MTEGFCLLRLIYLGQVKQNKTKPPYTSDRVLSSVLGFLWFLLIYEMRSGNHLSMVVVYRTHHSLKHKQGSRNQRFATLPHT